MASRIRDRADLLALAAILLALPLLPKHVPAGIYGFGIVNGASLALLAAGLVLVYRSNRIINFAQVQFGVLAGVLFRLLVEQSMFLRAISAVCEACILRPTRLETQIDYWLSLVVSLAAAGAISYLSYVFIIRRFAKSPRLLVTVVTIGLAQLLSSLQVALPGLMATAAQKEQSQFPIGVAARPPFDFTIHISTVIFHASDILLVIVAVITLAILALVMRFSASGIAIRSCSENPDRARTLGMQVDRLNARVWLTAGLLSGIAAILPAMSGPSPEATSLSIGLLVRLLGVAVIAGLGSLPIAVAAAFGIGIFDQVVQSAYGPGVVDGLMFVLIGGVLLLQRYKPSRAEQEGASSWKIAAEVKATPIQLKDVASVRTMKRTVSIVVALLALGLPWFASPRQVSVASTVQIYAMVGLSLLVLSGWAGQVSLGQFALAAIGGYVATVLGADLHLPLPLAVLGGAFTGMGVAIAIGIPALKLRGLHLAITTLSAALAASSILLNPNFLGKFLPQDLKRPLLLGINLNDQRAFYYLALLALVFVVAGVTGLRRSRTGRALIAARENEWAAQSFGINLLRARLLAFAISGFIAAFAGGLFAYQEFGVKAADYAPEVSVLMFLMAVIGGLGSVSGPIMGAVYIGLLNILSNSPLVRFLATGGGVVALLLFSPGGVGQAVFAARDSLLRRIARRNAIVVPSLVADQKQMQGDARSPIAPKLRPGGGSDFIATRYRLEEEQWAIGASAKPRQREVWSLAGAPVDEQSVDG